MQTWIALLIFVMVGFGFAAVLAELRKIRTLLEALDLRQRWEKVTREFDDA